jgi:hypothetical protein
MLTHMHTGTLFDGAIHSYVVDLVQIYSSKTMLVGYIEYFTEMLWPGGVMLGPGEPISDGDRAEVKADIKAELANLVRVCGVCVGVGVCDYALYYPLICTLHFLLSSSLSPSPPHPTHTHTHTHARARRSCQPR